MWCAVLLSHCSTNIVFMAYIIACGLHFKPMCLPVLGLATACPPLDRKMKRLKEDPMNTFNCYKKKEGRNVSASQLRLEVTNFL